MNKSQYKKRSDRFEKRKAEKSKNDCQGNLSPLSFRKAGELLSPGQSRVKFFTFPPNIRPGKVKKRGESFTGESSEGNFSLHFLHILPGENFRGK